MLSPYANAQDDDGRPLTNVHCEHAPQTGIHLYHYPLSFYSQKVRQVLEEKRVHWTSHVIQLPDHEQYEPDYVRINPRCVVPTFVQDGRVTTDAANINRHLETAFSKPSLVPSDEGEAVVMELFLRESDAAFVEALTYGEVPGVSRPFGLDLYTRGEHTNKVRLLSDLVQKHRADPYLTGVYSRKLAIVEKTLDAMTSSEEMVKILASMKESIQRLEHQLKVGPASHGGWLASDTFSLADIEWGVLFYRLKFVGLQPHLWGGRPLLKRYATRLFARPSFKVAVVAWSSPVTQILIPTVIKRIKKMF